MLLEDISLFNCLNGYILVFQPYLQDIHVVVYSFSGLQCRISLNFNSVGENQLSTGSSLLDKTHHVA